ncbi:MAG: extracellular solute-binding protein [Clostridia bacterium]|nr:extracellular solute-binding protein [Clostridia bacterium]
MSNRSTIKKMFRSSVCLLLALIMSMSMCVVVFAEDADTGADDSYLSGQINTDSSETESYLTGFVRDNLYNDYYDKFMQYDMVLPTVEVDGASYASATAKVKSEGTFEGATSVAVIEGRGDLTYTVNVPETGMYAVEMNYFPIINENGNDIEIAIKIDGKTPFEEAAALNLKRVWVNELKDGKISTDSIGNELLPNQIQAPHWIAKDLYDAEGRYLESFKFYLTAGAHTLTLTVDNGEFGLDSMVLHNEGAKISYDEYLNNAIAAGAQDTAAQLEPIEAELFTDKSDSIIQMAFDRSDARVTPYSISTTKYNTLGGTNWQKSGNRVNWTIEVPEDGLYELSFRYRQSYQRGMSSYRALYIDGEIPFAEAYCLAFDYKTGFQYMVAGRELENGEIEDYKFYLTAGTHTLSLEASIGKMSDTYRDVESIIYQLNYIYRKIVLITGITPDANRDYELFKRIADLEEMMNSAIDSMKTTKANVDALNDGNGGGDAEILNTLVVQMEDFVKKPYSIPSRLDTFKDNISTLGNWLLDIRDQPLCIDKFYVAGSEANLGKQTSNLFEFISHEVRGFISSFVDDYTAVGGSADEDERAISVWVGTGRDQAIALKTLTDNYFTPETEIGVNISLVPLAILSKAIIAGKGPNVALHVSRTEPINLGIRGALVDIQDMEGYKDVQARFSKYAMAPYTFTSTLADGTEYSKTFGLPETQNFEMMFYRTDIFAELGITAPKTWDEFDAILPVIQSNNMTVGLNQNTGGGMFFTLIQQQDGLIYTPDGSKTCFTEQYAVDAFTKWTDYYRMYDFPLTYSFYTRFRSGEMPLAFQPYSQATFIEESAPELRGLWAMAPVPGTLDENGKLNRTEESSGLTASIIIKSIAKSEEKRQQEQDDSWTFIKWWTSADIAAQYGKRVEMAIGPVARYTTANLEAFDMIGWDHEHAAVIKEQRTSVKEIPEVVGGYYVSRMVTNAFRAVTNNYSNQREMLFYYDDQINNEIWRKRQEYNFSIPEEADI